MHYCRCPEDKKKKLWAECANIQTDLWNIQVQKDQDKSPHELFFDTLPQYAHNLQIFGQAGVVLKSGKKSIKAKLTSRGDRKYFVGYAKNHSHDVYRMWNPTTGRVSVTRDIRWLDRFIGDDYGTTASPDETDELDDATSASGENDGDDDNKTVGDDPDEEEDYSPTAGRGPRPDRKEEVDVEEWDGWEIEDAHFDD